MKKFFTLLILLSIGITQIYAQCFNCEDNTKAFTIGTSTNANNYNSFAGGASSSANGENSFAFGFNSTINGLTSIGLGSQLSVQQQGSIAIGNNLTSNAAYSLLFGRYLTGTGNNSITIGTGSSGSPLTNTKSNSIMFGVTNLPSLAIVKPTNGTIGYLGIGTDDPKEMAHVVGKFLIERTSETKSSLQFKHFNTAKGIDPGNPGNPGANQYYWDIYSDTVGLKFNTVTNFGIHSTYKLNMILSKDGSVGIGVPNPQAKLDVNGSFKATSANITGTLSVQTLNAQNLAFDGNTIFNGKVGIFTSNPVAMLHLHDSKIENPRDDTNDSTDIKSRGIHRIFQITTGNSATDGFTIHRDASSPSVLFFKQHDQQSLSIEGPGGGLTIAPNGKIDIGNLEVTGALKAATANITGALTANSAEITGKIKTNSAEITGVLTANSATITDVIKASKAEIKGKIKAQEVEVTLSGWSDFVFENDYPLMNLQKVEQFIKENKHLPNVPSAAEVEVNGVELGAMNAILLQKVEELTLYILDLQKQINELKTK